jgi:drug/metabolite transporter (DMT)-like permease
MTTEKPNLTKELALLLALSTLWGASYSFIKIGVETIPPITLIAARTLIAGLILVVIIRWRGLSLPKDAIAWRRFLFQACLNSVIPFTLIAWGERDPYFTVAGARAFLRDQPEAELHLLPTGHFALAEECPAIAALIRDFYRRHVSRERREAA